MFQVLLKSGRGIRFSELTPAERDSVLVAAGKLIGNEGTFLELRSTEHRMGIKQMIRAVTEKDGLTDEDLVKPETKWKQVNTQVLDDKYDSWFTSKDHAVLAAIYRRYHEVDVDELEAIVGKALPVSEG